MRIISGGQTGVDRLALEVARAAGIPTGGTAPRKFLTERGPDPSLAQFGLAECGAPGYRARTEANVKDAHVTLLFTAYPGRPLAGGSALTARLCAARGKPCFVNPAVGQLRFSSKAVVNVAGTRGSRLPAGRAAEIRATLRAILRPFAAAKNGAGAPGAPGASPATALGVGAVEGARGVAPHIL